MRKTLLQRTLLNVNWWLGRKQKFGAAPNRTVTLVVPAYNEELTIADTIKSIQRQTYNLINPIHIIVVDDHSSDHTGDVARSLGVEVMRPEKNTGTKAQAMNYALPFIDSEMFACVDADTVLKEDAVENAMRYFNDENTGLVCGFVLPQFSNTLWERGRMMEYLFAFTVIKGAQEHTSGVMVASGCFTIIPTKLLKDIGGYSNRTMAEDLDVTWSAIERGYLARFASDAICWVVDPKDRKTYHQQLSRWTHGYIQNIKVRNYNLFNHKFSLGLVAYFYFIWSVVEPFFMPLLIWRISSDWLTALLSMIMLYSLTIWIPSGISAWRLGIPMKVFIKTIPPMFVIQYFSVYVFLETVFKEFVLNKTVTVWHKGH